ncbi:MAG: D-2-hydroxyacid dehydrogenase [Ilumatobacteraceae bacterium]
MGDVLFCTDTFWDRRGDEVAAIAPELDVVRLIGKEHVDDTDVARVTLAFFSADAWPERAPNFMRVCLQATGLRWLHSMSAGVDNPVFRSLLDRGVTVTTSSGSSASPIAQTVMMYLLALTRDLPGWLRAQAEHRWEPRAIRELDGLTMGVVGMGPIGVDVARLGTALGMRPIGVRRTVRGDEPCETWTFDRLGELVASVDVLVIAIPLTDDTRGLIGADAFAAMRPCTLFVNVGRGEIVDEPAMIEALRSGHLGGAGLDVFATEPLPADSPLWDLPNVIVTPHSSGTSARAGERAEDIFLDNLTRHAAGRDLRNRA